MDENIEKKIEMMKQTRNIENKNNLKGRGKRNKKRELNKKVVKAFKIIIIMIAICLILFLVALKVNDYIIVGENTKTNLIINNNNVTVNIENDVIVKDDIIYISKSDIAKYFDEYIYEEEEINKVVTTYRKKIAEIGYDDNTIVINGSNKEIEACLLVENDETYLPISEMLEVYEIEIEYIEETDIVLIDSTYKEQVKAIITKDAAIKSSTNLISKTLDRVDEGEYVVVISKTDDYAKVRTDDGKIGYVKLNKIANEIEVREQWDDELQVDGTINMTWEYFSEYASAPELAYIEGVNVVSPSFFYLNSDGELEENVGEDGLAYIEAAKEYGYRVWPMVSNSGDRNV